MSSIATQVPVDEFSVQGSPSVLSLARRSAVPYLVSRAVVILAVGAAIDLGDQLPARRYAGPWPDPAAGPRILQGLGSWDGTWYTSIAGHGYTGLVHGPASSGASAVAFFPLWPLLIRAVSDITRIPILVTGVVLAFLFGYVAASVVWLVARQLAGDAVADRALAYWCFFPGALVLSMVYAEGLTVATCGLCLLFLLRRKWLAAGVAGGLATSVQPEAIAVIACCAQAAAIAVYRHRDWRSVLAPVLSTGGVVAYFAYLYTKSGDPLLWFHVERRVWGSGTGLVHDTFGVIRATIERPQVVDEAAVALGLLVAVAGIVFMLRWRPPAVIWVFTVGVLVEALGSNEVGMRSRVLLTAFPLFIAVATRLKRSYDTAVVGGFATVLGALTLVVLSQVIVAP